MKLPLMGISMVIGMLNIAAPAPAITIDFTGGTVHQFGGATFTTDTTTSYDNVDYYEENGVKVDFIGPPGDEFSYIVGDFYRVGNDVAHGHWAGGFFGVLESILVQKIDGGAFDLDYLKIATNSSRATGPVAGDEEVYLNALADGINVSYSMLLPPDDSGFAGSNPEIFLGDEFDNILAFSFTYGSNAVGFGIDEFLINDSASSTNVPEPSSVTLFAVCLAGFGLNRIKRKLVKS